MKKYISMAMALALTMSAMAQETYESAQINSEDLNGTARYVGMGGAMEALGADISVMGSNPAGIGLFRRSAVSMSFGFTSIKESKSTAPNGHSVVMEGKTPASFDQIGFVFSMPAGSADYVNFGFNYHKSKNFNEILSAANILSNASQNKGSYIKALRGNSNNGGFCIGTTKDKEYIGYDNIKSDYTSRNYSEIDYLYWNALLVDPKTGDYGYNLAESFAYGSEGKGYIGEYDFNLSGNHDDRLFWGFTLGVKDVNYERYTDYQEVILNKGEQSGTVDICDERKVTGYGFNISGGIIFRPVVDSPFRIGLSVTSPTWYDLRSSNYTTLANRTSIGAYDRGKSNESYKYKLFTPWKFGASLGHTFGQDLALGLSYEYTDYSAIDNRNIVDEYYDYWNASYRSSSESDQYMNANTRKSLKGVSTIKFGFEGKLSPEFAVRAGYNYVSPAYSKSGARSTCLNANGCYYTSTTDYTNWQETHRVTCGLGYAYRNFNIDLAYQYSSQKGEFHPFENMEEGNVASATDIRNEKHQLLMTLGWKF